MTTDFSADLPQLLERATDDMIDLRHDLHAHPELAYLEHRTTQVITDRLRSLEWDIQPCPTETGAVAVLDTGRPGKTVLIRADIDGLPVTEERELSFRSTTDDVMHACGHDVHTAALLGLADVIGQRRESLGGKFVVLFQPAEESLGGAKRMIDGGVLRDLGVDYAIGAHVTSLAPVGIVASRPGVIMSEANGFRVDIRGKGGHGAMASSEGNVVLAVSALAHKVGGAVHELSYDGGACACSAGVITAGTANNVVPRHATLQGTLRTFTDEQTTEARRRLDAILNEISTEYAVECTFHITSTTPRVENHVAVNERVEASARKVVGDDFVWRIPPASPSDDMSEFLRAVPGAYIFIGGGLADGSSGMHHSPDFAIDDAAVPMVASVLATAAVDLAQG